jgi:hypothetical protein
MFHVEVYDLVRKRSIQWKKAPFANAILWYAQWNYVYSISESDFDLTESQKNDVKQGKKVSITNFERGLSLSIKRDV